MNYMFFFLLSDRKKAKNLFKKNLTITICMEIYQKNIVKS